MTPDLSTYPQLLEHLKAQVQSARLRAVFAVNTKLLQLYWQIGTSIDNAQRQEGWGAKVVERLAADLRRAFPDMKGFSRTNLLDMRAFAQAWPQEVIVQQPVGQLPWGHNLILLDKLVPSEERLWYAQAAREHGWSRNVLALQIDGRPRKRQGRAVTNFTRTLPKGQSDTLPKGQSDLAREALKDSYGL